MAKIVQKGKWLVYYFGIVSFGYCFSAFGKNAKHLKKILSSYLEYYHKDRTHSGLEKDAPFERPSQSKPENVKIIALPKVGGLHHRYEWRKAA